jgi:small neutral amino acid transporter SnatA (MarC family)
VTEMPWGALFGLLFMTMGPIRAIAVFSKVGERDDAPGVRALAFRAAGLVAAAFLMTVLIGNGVLTAWGVSYPILILAGGVVLTALSLQTLLSPAAGPGTSPDPETMPAAAVAFPGLFPPIAVSVPLIFSVPFPGWETKIGILAIGGALIARTSCSCCDRRPSSARSAPCPSSSSEPSSACCNSRSGSSSSRTRSAMI